MKRINTDDWLIRLAELALLADPAHVKHADSPEVGLPAAVKYGTGGAHFRIVTTLISLGYIRTTPLR